MSGGHFEYNQHKIDEIAGKIQTVIDRNGTEIPKEKRWSQDPTWYEKYPEDKFYPKHPVEILEKFKEAVEVLKKASVYAQRVDWYISGDDGEESFLKRLKEDLDELKK